MAPVLAIVTDGAPLAWAADALRIRYLGSGLPDALSNLVESAATSGAG